MEEEMLPADVQSLVRKVKKRKTDVDELLKVPSLEHEPRNVLLGTKEQVLKSLEGAKEEASSAMQSLLMDGVLCEPDKVERLREAYRQLERAWRRYCAHRYTSGPREFSSNVDTRVLRDLEDRE